MNGNHFSPTKISHQNFRTFSANGKQEERSGVVHLQLQRDGDGDDADDADDGDNGGCGDDNDDGGIKAGHRFLDVLHYLSRFLLVT